MSKITPTDAAPLPPETARAAVGRPRDAELDLRIMRAALAQVAEGGFHSLTMDAVAKRIGAGKASLYRRWKSRDALLADALLAFSPTDLPIDTGTLRGDLITVYEHFYGLHDPDIRVAVIEFLGNHRIMSGWVEQEIPGWLNSRRVRVLEIIERAISRGELQVPAQLNLDLLIDLLPGVIQFRHTERNQRVDNELIVEVVDHVLLPLLSR
ncbi:TetR/AcrR family transcriptional regulator [Serratia marcescens]|uniref:TetR/AcrR family transcriptional regulator n=1 Tax=Serratia marcescens TaxID=615 RepID=UPI0013DAD281|nr:TetR/AcrR family transcriptional regulator [Serratia marcescens]HCR2982370.1 TetR/AcrR family transcriptional regulator [Serratia marcescens]HCR2988027.1 TetR/AcrR family transcriptional regulator [Serratia marcescens]HCR3012345.1 TetR/AcrR family transcriptional regulator [Serratia marcescens]